MKGEPQMKTHETTTPVRAFDRALYQRPVRHSHGTRSLNSGNPTDNKVIGKVTMADEIDTRKVIGAAKEAFNTFSQSSKEYRMEPLQQPQSRRGLSEWINSLKRMVVEYGAPQDPCEGLQQPRGEHFPALQESPRRCPDLGQNCRHI